MIHKRSNEQLELLERYYQQYGPLILKFLSARVGTDQAGDLLQDVFVEAAKHFDRLYCAVSPRGWLMKVAYNLMCNYYRDKTPATGSISNEIADTKTGKDDRFLEIKTAVSELDDKSQEVIMLRWYSQMSYQEISHILDLPVGTVRSRLHYSLIKLRNKLVKIPEFE